MTPRCDSRFHSAGCRLFQGHDGPHQSWYGEEWDSNKADRLNDFDAVVPSMTTPEPSTLLTDEELDALLKLPGCGLGHAHGINCGVPVNAQLLDRLIAQARAARPSPWQPIETAPKDGARVLIGWWNDDGVWDQRCAYWDAVFTSDWNEETNETVHIGEWTDGAVQSFNYEETHCYKPTHWQPLPSPPAQDGGLT